MITCSFCSKPFDPEDSQKGCQGCPMNGVCSKYKCPHCGYEMLKEPGMIKWIKSKFKKQADKENMNKPKTVIHLEAGSDATILELNTQNQNTIKKLMALGVMPGLTLNLIQRYPSFVIRVGQTQIALDHETAAVIVVN